MRYCLYIICLFISVRAGAVPTSVDTLVIKNLLHETYFFNSGSSSYLPLIDYDTHQSKTVHLKLEKSQAAGLALHIRSDQELAIFIDQKLISKSKANAQVWWDTDSLFKTFGDSFHLTLYNPRLTTRGLTIGLSTQNESTGSIIDEEHVIIPKQRQDKSTFNNFLILGFVSLLAFLAVLYNYYPRVTIEFLRLRRALAVREIEENLLKSRPFSWINIFFYIFFSLLIGYMLLIIMYLAPLQRIEDYESIGETIWFWFEVSGALMGWILVKYLLIRNFSILFNIRHFISSHYFNYIRIGLFIFIVMVCLVIVSYLGLEITHARYYKTLFTLLLLAVSGRVIFLMFKLMNSASYKFFHLFSYLCATEIMPLGVILFLGFNQLF